MPRAPVRAGAAETRALNQKGAEEEGMQDGGQNERPRVLQVQRLKSAGEVGMRLDSFKSIKSQGSTVGVP